jgi:two-component system, NarL family, response regulator NreC
VAKTVVIVDDKAIMRQALCRLFTAAGGFRVCGEASNGLEAVELAKNLKPDLMVLDLLMPGMNGLDTARKLKSLNMPTQTILYSMNADDIAANEAFSAGVSALVSKAEGVKTLIKKARSVLNQHMT